MRTRWRSPPESVAKRCAAQSAHADGIERARAPRRRRARRNLPTAAACGKRPSEHVVENAAPVRAFLDLQEDADRAGALACVDPRQRFAVELDSARGRTGEPRERVYERALARAVAAEHRPHLARLEARRRGRGTARAPAPPA